MTAVPWAEPPRSQGCQYWLSAGTDWNTLDPPTLRRGQGTWSVTVTSSRASGPRSTCSASVVPANASPAKAPSSVGRGVAHRVDGRAQEAGRVGGQAEGRPVLAVGAAVDAVEGDQHAPVAGSVNRQK